MARAFAAPVIFVVAYEAESTLEPRARAYSREHLGAPTPRCSSSTTPRATGRSRSACVSARNAGIASRCSTTRVNQGYGGNQKLGYLYADRPRLRLRRRCSTATASTRPSCSPTLLEPLARRRGRRRVRLAHADAAARRWRGGMPLYKFVGNRILTRSRTPARHVAVASSTRAIAPTRRGAASRSRSSTTRTTSTSTRRSSSSCSSPGCRIVEVPIPTYYGDEICHVNGIKYAKDVIALATLAQPAASAERPLRPQVRRRSTTVNAATASSWATASSHTAALDARARRGAGARHRLRPRRLRP